MMKMGAYTMSAEALKRWIAYWDAASDGPNLRDVKTLETMGECRRWNRAMRTGLMFDVTDAQMLAALQDHRSELPPVKAIAEAETASAATPA